jgi:hypothetical protein
MDYKEYYNEIKKKLESFSEVVYYEPMTDKDVLQVEKQIGQSIKPLYREYLLTFGMVQDAFGKLVNDIDSFIDDFNFIEKTLKGYLPVSSEIEVDNAIFLINNNDLQDDYVYRVTIDSNDNIGKLKKLKPFQQIIKESITALTKNHASRCLNKDKINNTEFNLSGKDFIDLVEMVKNKELKQKTDWQPKYYPNNIFGDEVAIFELFDNEIAIERNEDHSQYRFELEESVLSARENSIIRKTVNLLKAQRIEFEKFECRLIEND